MSEKVEELNDILCNEEQYTLRCPIQKTMIKTHVYSVCVAKDEAVKWLKNYVVHARETIVSDIGGKDYGLHGANAEKNERSRQQPWAKVKDSDTVGGKWLIGKG